MNKENFDYYWRIALIIVLIIFFIIFIFEFTRYNKQGSICLNDPLSYATKHLIDEKQYNFRYSFDEYNCALECYSKGGYYFK